MRRIYAPLAVAAICAGGIAFGAASAKDATPSMSFFITSAGSGDGANLGGIAGADAHCAKLAKAAGSKKKTWRAYLSASAEGGKPQVDAKDRIGKGPWHNAKGVLIAANVADLHLPAVPINKETALTETGATVKARGDTPNQHDILTGTALDGTLAKGQDGAALTCSNWTSGADGQGAAMVGHHDRASLQPGLSPWNAAHPSRGCSQANLVGTGGAGMFYCLAAD